jgi:predicted permease
VGAAKKLFGIGMMRWAIMPLLSASVIFAAESAGFHFEPLLKFFLMMQASMPSAQNTTIMLQLANRKEAANSMARTLFLVYVAGILPTSLLITYYMTSFGIG